MDEQELNDVFEIQRLMDENAKLKVELEHYRSYKRRIKMRSRNLQAENERLKGELEMEHDDCSNAKKCEIEYHKAYEKELDENATLRNENEQLQAENERLNTELNVYHDLIDRIDYCYLQIDGSYGDMKKGGLAYCVADKVKYIRRKGWIPQASTEDSSSIEKEK